MYKTKVKELIWKGKNKNQFASKKGMLNRYSNVSKSFQKSRSLLLTLFYNTRRLLHEQLLLSILII